MGEPGIKREQDCTALTLHAHTATMKDVPRFASERRVYSALSLSADILSRHWRTLSLNHFELLDKYTEILYERSITRQPNEEHRRKTGLILIEFNDLIDEILQQSTVSPEEGGRGV